MSYLDYKSRNYIFYKKYYKYKNKYIQLKNKIGGAQLKSSDNLDCKIYLILIDNDKKGLTLEQLKEVLKVDDIKEIEIKDYMNEYNIPSLISFSFKPNIMNNPNIFKQIFEINDYNFDGLNLINAVDKMGYGYGDDPDGTLTQLELQIIEQFREKGLNLEWHLDPEGGERGCGTYMRLEDSSDICMMFFDILKN